MGKPYEIIFADDDLLVVDKTCALSVQKDKTGDEDIQSLLSREQPSPSGFLEACHRIDRRTSGLVLFARNPPALAKLEKDFQDRNVQKTYLACLEKEPIPEAGDLEHRIVHDQRRNITVARPDPVPGEIKGRFKRASLHYSLILKTDRYFFVQVEPRTGRHHQIRAQFAAAGWPIKGDLKYGARRGSDSGRIMLHAWKLAFRHPRTGKPMGFEAPLPGDEKLWQVLGEHMAKGGNTDAQGPA